jgi:lysophospholipase L1-like esterase
MSLASNVNALATRVATEIKAVKTSLSSLPAGLAFLAADATSVTVGSTSIGADGTKALLAASDPILKAASARPLAAGVTVTNSGSVATVTGRTIGRTDPALTFNGPTRLSGDGNWLIAQQPLDPQGVPSSNLSDAMLGIEFMFDGQAFEFLTLGFGATYLITVDGALVSATPASVGNSSGDTYIKINLGSRGRRRIGLWMAYGYFNGLRLAVTDSVWSIGTSTPTIAFLGDSYCCYGPMNPSIDWDAHNYYTYAQQLGRLLGFRAVTNFAASGTGYVTANSGSFIGAYSTRLDGLVSYAPDVVIVQGSLNDAGANLTTYTAAVHSVLSNLRTRLPNTLIIATGILDARATGSQSGDAALNAAIQSEAMALGIPYIDTAGWIFGTGTIASPTGDGNRDLYGYTDGAHPYAPAGADFLAARLCGPVRALLA